jgi:hypothetical protein
MDAIRVESGATSGVDAEVDGLARNATANTQKMATNTVIIPPPAMRICGEPSGERDVEMSQLYSMPTMVCGALVCRRDAKRRDSCYLLRGNA